LLLLLGVEYVQSNARDDERTRADIEHIRRLMSENQNALATVITVLSSIQEEVRRLSITVHKQQTSVLQIQPPSSGSAAAGTSKNATGSAAGITICNIQGGVVTARNATGSAAGVMVCNIQGRYLKERP